VADPSVTGYRIYYNTVASGGSPGHLDISKPTTSLEFQPGAFGIAAGTTIYLAISSIGAGSAESPLSPVQSVTVQ
jgi:hypothetical protein